MKLAIEEISQLAAAEQNIAISSFKSESEKISPVRNANSLDRTQVISQVDIKVQEILLKFILENWPFVSLLVEEDTNTKKSFQDGHKYYILLDPIDGTSRYIAGSSQYCHTVALMKDKDMIVSILYSHKYKKLYFSIKNQGAFYIRNNKENRIKISCKSSDTILFHVDRIPNELNKELTQFGYRMTPSSQNATDILGILYEGTKGFISLNPVIYDVWAPALIIAEAGGWVSDWKGDPPVFNKKARIPHLLIARSEADAKNALKILGKYSNQ